MNASRKVLVVDDDPAVRKSIDRVLTGKGYAVITAENGEEALRKLNEEKYDLVYTDIRMPGMSGLEVAEQVKARKPWTPVVIITGYGTDAAASPRQGRRRLEFRAQTAVARDDRRQRPRCLGGAPWRKCWPCRRRPKRPRPNRPRTGKRVEEHRFVLCRALHRLGLHHRPPDCRPRRHRGAGGARSGQIRRGARLSP